LAFVLLLHIRFISTPSGGRLRKLSQAVRATMRGSADVRTDALEATLTTA
jgi:hypothetical protein